MAALSPRYFCISPSTLFSKTLNNFKYEIALQRHKDENFRMIIKNINRFYAHHHLLPPNFLQRSKNGEPPELENYYHPDPSRAKKKGLTEICKCSSTFHGRSLITPHFSRPASSSQQSLPSSPTAINGCAFASSQSTLQTTSSSSNPFHFSVAC